MSLSKRRFLFCVKVEREYFMFFLNDSKRRKYTNQQHVQNDSTKCKKVIQIIFEFNNSIVSIMEDRKNHMIEHRQELEEYSRTERVHQFHPLLLAVVVCHSQK
ncbi:hypothetical protein T11_14764 [Trichinella zimbabwensis]|uniref:Uncharacterized protein n=1 Tax=Trichinella zimbabwensis TaxID=268475 RepID=A0A0V1GZZ1_9BILA|nr:hypothetical protein T11_14764 [Trichinella zimbabwensis]